MVAPYEADSQLAYLEKEGIIDGIITEDSDLLVFGCKKVLFKLDTDGQCIEIMQERFAQCKSLKLSGWTVKEFRQMAIFSGCDYLPSILGLGLKNAHRLLRQYKTPDRVVRHIIFEGKLGKVPENYLKEFRRAELTFVHQRVFDPRSQKMTLLNPVPQEAETEAMQIDFIGAPIDDEEAAKIASGDVDPISRQPMVDHFPNAGPAKRAGADMARSESGTTANGSYYNLKKKETKTLPQIKGQKSLGAFFGAKPSTPSAKGKTKASEAVAARPPTASAQAEISCAEPLLAQGSSSRFFAGKTAAQSTSIASKDAAADDSGYWDHIDAWKDSGARQADKTSPLGKTQALSSSPPSTGHSKRSRSISVAATSDAASPSRRAGSKSADSEDSASPSKEPISPSGADADGLISSPASAHRLKRKREDHFSSPVLDEGALASPSVAVVQKRNSQTSTQSGEIQSCATGRVAFVESVSCSPKLSPGADLVEESVSVLSPSNHPPSPKGSQQDDREGDLQESPAMIGKEIAKNMFARFAYRAVDKPAPGARLKQRKEDKKVIEDSARRLERSESASVSRVLLEQQPVTPTKSSSRHRVLGREEGEDLDFFSSAPAVVQSSPSGRLAMEEDEEADPSMEAEKDTAYRRDATKAGRSSKRAKVVQLDRTSASQPFTSASAIFAKFRNPSA